jgi:pyruvate dehydrogenase E2 component (dihydrolipoamide acetyltransferase)
MPTATAQVFRLPDLGEGLTEAELVQWLVRVGDTIAIDQAIAEVETAKSIVELPSPYAGVVVALHGEAGDTLAVGEPLIEVGGDGPAVATADAEPADVVVSDVELETHREEERAGSGNVLIGYGTSDSHGAARRRTRAGKKPVSAAPEVESTAAPASVSAASASPAPTASVPPASVRVAVRSPLLRRLARDLGVDVTSLTPSGAGGVITRGDILRAASAADPTAPATAPISTSIVTPDIAAGPVETGREKLGMLRRTVAAKMSQSRREIPEATVWVDVDATRLWDLRREMVPDGERAPSLTALLAKFTLLALAEYPLFASRLNDDGSEVIRYEGVHLGVAADTERGLVVPVMPRADLLSVAALDEQLRALSASARTGALPPERLRGSTFTLNNYGSLGVDGSAAIINHPEVAILGVGRMIERPWVVDGQIVPRRIVQLSLVFDHRICDGGYAAGFLRHIVGSIEHPLAHYRQL